MLTSASHSPSAIAELLVKHMLDICALFCIILITSVATVTSFYMIHILQENVMLRLEVGRLRTLSELQCTAVEMLQNELVSFFLNVK